MSMSIRTPVLWFAHHMERVLKANDKTKGEYGYLGEDPQTLLSGLMQEAEELRQALDSGENIIDEAVDVANYAMMIALNQFIKKGDQESHEQEPAAKST